MERIPIKDWTKLSYEEKLAKVKYIQSLRESCRREAMKVPTKTARKQTTSNGKKISKKKPAQSDINKLLKKLSPAQIKSLKQSYGVE